MPEDRNETTRRYRTFNLRPRGCGRLFSRGGTCGRGNWRRTREREKETLSLLIAERSVQYAARAQVQLARPGGIGFPRDRYRGFITGCFDYRRRVHLFSLRPSQVRRVNESVIVVNAGAR